GRQARWQESHRPPRTPRGEMWQRVAAARAARRQRAIVLRPWLRWGLGIAAVLVLGFAIGRWTAGGPGRAGAPAAADAASGADRGKRRALPRLPRSAPAP